VTLPATIATPRNGQIEPLIEMRHVRKVFGGGSMFSRHNVAALKDFSLSIAAERPTIIAVVGESGSGKTTMARILLGLESPTTGEVRYRGTDLRKLSPGAWKDYRRNVQAIFQDPFGVYNSFYKVDHVLETPLRKFKLAGSRDESRRMIEQALRAVGLQPENTLGRYPHQLSGGQRQRTMVARTLLLRPHLIVADEPVSMIDASLRATVLGNLLQLKRQFGISLVYITHDLTTAYQISDHIVVLYRGEVVEDGDPEDIVNRPRHPYTRLLISSIPAPDPDRAWADGALDDAEDDGEVTIAEGELEYARRSTADSEIDTQGGAQR
jgi:ABC-type oligopeptide transport system ATPase subunit